MNIQKILSEQCVLAGNKDDTDIDLDIHCNDLTYYLSGCSSNPKYRNIMISNDLLGAHVEYVTCKANRGLGLLRRNFKECPQGLREIEYFSMVRSFLEYATAVWAPT